MTLQRFILCAALTSTLPALAEPELEAQIDAYLGSLDAPVKAEDWRALGPRALAILEQRALAQSGFPTVRARAAEALGLVGTEQHGNQLLAVVAEEEAPLIVRLSALRGAGRLLPAERVAAAFRPLLEKDDHPRVRGAAADVLAERLGIAGCALAQKQLKRETAANRGMFLAAIKRCEKPPSR